MYSVDYENFRRYLEGGFNYLTSNGRLLLGFSPTVGECEMLDDIVKELCLSKTVLQEGRYEFA